MKTVIVEQSVNLKGMSRLQIPGTAKYMVK